MFICRFRLLSRLLLSPLPSRFSHVIIPQRFSSRATIPSQQCLAVHIPLHPSSSPTHTSDRDLSPAANIQDAGDRLSRWLSQDTSRQPIPHTDQEAKEKGDPDHSLNLCTLYARPNTSEFSVPATQLSLQQIPGIVLRMRNAGHISALDDFTRNILDSPEPGRTELATTLLSIPRLRLNPSLTASLLSCIIPDRLSSLSLVSSSHIACTLIHHPSPSSTETLLTHLAEHIARHLKPLWRKKQDPLINGAHTIPTWSLFRLVVHLSELHLREPAMRLLQSLIEAAYIPPEAIQRTDQSSRDFHLIITLTLVRSCIFWKWNRRALAILRNYLSGKSSAGPIVSRLCEDVLYALMEFPTVEDMNLGVSFIKDMATNIEPIFVSPGIVRQVYSSAQRLDQFQTAASLYKLSQSEASHNFPLPSGAALTWLLRNLSSQPAYLHLARRLVEQVVDRCEPIPLTGRAEFIAIAAESGFASHARSLWERYSSGRGGRSVAGNAAMVVRMCSLFANLRRRKAIHTFKKPGTTTASPIGHSRDLKDQCISWPGESEQEKDLENFANLVLTRYREAKEPLHQASREDLNALARANIILGHITEGFQVLRVVIDRNERPDLHDINVVLSAIAKVDPRMALKMVQRMVTIGPEPDSISFGTVIHQAARHCDSAVISSLLQLARESGQQLTTKTIVTIIRASVAFSGADKDAVRDNLVLALGVIIANKHSNHLPTLHMGRFCVEEALKADDPTLAFRFWKHLLKSADQDDDSHASLRGRIASSIRCHYKKGYIRAGDSHKMISALKARRGV
jgi:hypothetical protein